MRLPGGPLLSLRIRPLAEAIASEWQAAGGGKGGSWSAYDVPLTRIACTAQERVSADPAAIVAVLVQYAAADLLCYRAEAPAALVDRQTRDWQPWLDWVQDRYAVELRVVHGLTHADQPDRSLAAMHKVLVVRSAFELAGLAVLVPALGSLVLSLAVADGALDAGAAHDLALLDELYQAEKWGDDHEAVVRRQHIAADVESAAQFIGLVT